MIQIIMCNNAYAEVKDFIGHGEYTMGEHETIAIAKEYAVREAERNAVEQAGVYVKSYTKTKNLITEEDIITVLTNGILWVKDKKITKDTTESGDIHLKVELLASIDTNDIEKKLNDEKNIDELKNEYNNLQQRYNNLENEMKLLKKSSSVEMVRKLSEQIDARIKIESELKEIQNEIKIESRGKGVETKRDCYNKAINRISSLIKKDPSFGELYLVRANMILASERLYLKKNKEKIKYAVEDYNIAEKLFINNNSKLAQVYDHRAAAYVSLGDYDKVIEDNTNLINIPESEKVYKNYILYLERGRTYIDFGEYQKAIEDANAALDLCNKNKDMDYVFNETYHIKSKAYEEMKKYAEAIECYTKLIKRNEDKSKTELGENILINYICDRGECYMNINDYTNARSDFDRCIELIKKKNKPAVTDGRPFLLRGGLSRRLNNYKEEVQIYTSGINYFTTCGVPINKKTYAYVNKLDLFEKEVARWNLNTLSMLYFNRGRANHDSEDYISAISDYKKYIQMDPKNFHENMDWAYLNLSKCYSMLGKKAEAIEYVDKAIVVNPKNQDAVLFKRFVQLT